MSRFAARKPFHPSGAFIAIRGFTANGEAYKSGDPVDIAILGERRAAQMYDQKRIDYAPDGVERAAKAPSAPAAPETTKKAAKATSGADKEPAGKEPEVKGYSMKYSGFGGWKVYAPDGAVVAEGIEDKADAEAKVAALNAAMTAQ